MIRVTNKDGLAAYYPSNINYINDVIDIDKKTINGSPYLEISDLEHQYFLDKQIILEDGAIRELTSQELKLRSEKIDDDIFAKMSYAEKRKKEYGSPSKQMENIIENGLAAEQERVLTIKSKYPKE